MGSWKIELMTMKRRIYLKPLEDIYIQYKGSMEILKHDFDDSLYVKFKLGIFIQDLAFIINDIKEMRNIKSHIENSKNINSKIIN